MIRGAIFDLDGTLGDTLPVCFAAFARVLGRRLGRAFADSEIRAMFGPSEEGILGGLCGDDREAAVAEYLREYRLAHAMCPRPFPGMREVLQMLRERGVELAIVTGKGARSARISLEIFGLEGVFPVVEAGSPAGGVKPQAMRRVLDRWPMPLSDVVAVGDSPSDIRSAARVGVASVAAAWAPGADAARLAACRPGRLFREVGELGAWLEEAVAPVRR